MFYKILIPFIFILFSSCSITRFYVVRHGEKEQATMSSDVALSEQGRNRAQSLKNMLLNEKIVNVYSTPYIRTRETVRPLADALGLPVLDYQPMDTAWMKHLRYSKNNTLVAGHSNTVDNIVNQLLGSKLIPGDLPESQYGDLYIITRKGKKYRWEKKSF
jgi:2,3-bisphosphoglycerate-dependent phosphoglycerate mutase